MFIEDPKVFFFHQEVLKSYWLCLKVLCLFSLNCIHIMSLRVILGSNFVVENALNVCPVNPFVLGEKINIVSQIHV